MSSSNSTTPVSSSNSDPSLHSSGMPDSSTLVDSSGSHSSLPSASSTCVCQILFEEETVVVPWIQETYDAAGNLTSESQGNFTWWIEFPEDAPDGESTIDSETGAVTFGSEGEEFDVCVNCVDCPNLSDSKFKLKTPKIDIYFKGEAVTGETKDVVVGEEVALAIRLTPDTLTVEAPVWSVPEKRVKDYDVSINEGHKQKKELLEGDLKDLKVGFYFVDDGEKTVEFSGTVGGVAVTANVTFNVFRPNTTVEMGFQPGGKDVRELPGQPPIFLQGIFPCVAQARASADDLKGGRLVWASVGSFEAVAQCEPPRRNRERIYPGKQIDGGFPTDDDAIFTDKPYNESRYTPDLLNSVKVDFVTTLMYRPEGDSSIWVPMKKFAWNGKAQLVYDLAQDQWKWSQAPFAFADVAAQNTFEFPTWDGKIPKPPTITNQ